MFGSYLITDYRTRFLSPSFPVDWKDLFLGFKNELIPKTSLEILLEPFDCKIWSVLTFFAIFGTIIISICKQSSLIKEFFIMICLLLGVATKISVQKAAFRIQYLCWMILGLIISSVHHAVFFDILKFDMNKLPPDTIHEIISTNFTQKILVPETSIRRVEHLKENTDFKIVTRNVLDIIPEMLQGSERVAALMTEMMVLFSGENVDAFYIMKDKFASVLNAIYFQKNSILLEDFNSIVVELYSGGILQKWHNDVFDGLLESRLDCNYVNALTMFQLKGIFDIWMVLLGVSFIVFVGEIIVAKVAWILSR